MRRRLISLEDDKLEVDKLHDREKAANQGNEYDLLYNNLKDTDEAKGAVKQDTEETPEEPTEDDSSSDTEQEPDAEYSEAVESIKELKYSPEAFATVISEIGDMAAVLGTMGIQYSVSGLKQVFKGVLYLFVKIARLSFTSMYMLSKYLERRRNSFENLKSSVNSLQEALKKAQETAQANSEFQDKYSSPSIINTLKIGSSVDFKDNLNQLTTYMDQTVKAISEQILHETNVISHILSSSRTGMGTLPKATMRLQPETMRLKEGTVQGYENSSEYVTSYHGDRILPGDIVVIATFPKDDLEEKHDIIRGYNDSSMVLGFDTQSFKEIQVVDYMTADGLTEFLNEMERLCDVCLAHSALYDRVRSSKTQLKSLLKNYFSFLSHSQKKVSVNDSFMEEVYLKTMFIDKVYLTAMMDMHDYVSRVLVAGTRFAKSNIEQLA